MKRKQIISLLLTLLMLFSSLPIPAYAEWYDEKTGNEAYSDTVVSVSDAIVIPDWDNYSGDDASDSENDSTWEEWDDYADFSGCIDIVRGAAQVLGISLPENFRQPFFSKSASEFWRRWHITLGEWMKEYLYMPIARSSSFIRFSPTSCGVYFFISSHLSFIFLIY